jgi:DNA-binding YbaB/EbfC family protein
VSDQFDMGSLIEQAQAVQQQLLAAQAEVAEREVEGQSGGGAVRVRMTGSMQVTGASISPAAADAGDVQMLEDLVVAACNDAIGRAKQLTEDALGGVDLGGLGRLNQGF